jgi:nucleoside-diphosphate-sugar epimerase
MPIRIFFTGVSGFVGGQLGQTLSLKHPEFEMTALVRTEEQAQKVQARWSHIRTVVGDLDSHDLLVREAAASDVVLRTYLLAKLLNM